jgi:hypothetical protein
VGAWVQLLLLPLQLQLPIPLLLLLHIHPPSLSLAPGSCASALCSRSRSRCTLSLVGVRRPPCAPNPNPAATVVTAAAVAVAAAARTVSAGTRQPMPDGPCAWFHLSALVWPRSWLFVVVHSCLLSFAVVCGCSLLILVARAHWHSVTYCYHDQYFTIYIYLLTSVYI